MVGSRSSMVLVTVGNILAAAAQWYLIWLFARQSGPQAVGVYSLLIAVMSPIFITAQLGLRNLYITLQTAVSWRCFVALRAVGIFTAVVLSLTVCVLVVPSHAWALGAAILVIKIADSTADLWFSRLQRSGGLRTFGLLLIVGAMGTASASTAAIAVSGSVLSAVVATAAVAVATATATCLFACRRPPVPAEAVGTRGSLLLARHGAPLALSQGVSSLLAYLPVAIVGWWGTAGEVGVFSSAAYLVTCANLLGASVQVAVLADARQRFETAGAAALLRTMRRSSAAILALLSPLVIVAVLVGPELLTLVYGPEFAIGHISVLFFSLAAVIVMPTYLLSSFHLVLNRYWVMTTVGAVSVGLVAFSGVFAGTLGFGAVESGSLAVLIAALVRYGGTDLLARRTTARSATAPAEAAGARPDDHVPPSTCPSPNNVSGRGHTQTSEAHLP